jgi:hypothetical protein
MPQGKQPIPEGPITATDHRNRSPHANTDDGRAGRSLSGSPPVTVRAVLGPSPSAMTATPRRVPHSSRPRADERSQRWPVAGPERGYTIRAALVQFGDLPAAAMEVYTHGRVVVVQSGDHGGGSF